MWKTLITLMLIAALQATNVHAGAATINSLSIKMIRAVGDYPGDTYDGTIELWFTTPINWPSTVACTNANRVYIDAKHKHLISAAYTAFTAGKRVNVYVNDQLPVRGGSCEVGFLDMVVD